MKHPSAFFENRRTLIVSFLMVMIAIKTGMILATGPMALELDAREYWNLSSQVLAGDIWMLQEPIAYRTPIYPWFLATVRAIAGSSALIWIVVIQGCLLIATCWIASSLAVIVSQREIARVWTLSVSLAAISSISFGRAVLSEVMFSFLLTLHVYCQAAYIERRSSTWAIGTALSLALSILTRPISMLLWVVDLVLLLRSEPKRIRDWFFMAIILMVTLSPWMIRNAYLFGKPSLTEFVGRNLWVVTFQGQAGAGLDLPSDVDTQAFRGRIPNLLANDDWRRTWLVSKALVDSGLNDAQADRAMRSVCIRAIADHPSIAIDRTLRRIVNYWRCVSTYLPQPTKVPNALGDQKSWKYSNPIVEQLTEKRWSLSVFANTLLAGLTGFAVVVLMSHRVTRRWGLWAGLILMYFSVITGLFEIPDYRYRMVIEPIMMSIVGAGLAVILDSFGRGDRLQIDRSNGC